MKHPIKMDDLGVPPLFLETSIYLGNFHVPIRSMGFLRYIYLHFVESQCPNCRSIYHSHGSCGVGQFHLGCCPTHPTDQPHHRQRCILLRKQLTQQCSTSSNGKRNVRICENPCRFELVTGEDGTSNNNNNNNNNRHQLEVKQDPVIFFILHHISIITLDSSSISCTPKSVISVMQRI